MSTDGPPRIGLVVEAPGDARMARMLVDRVLLHARDWLDPDQLDLYRSYSGVDLGTDHCQWKKIPELCRKHRVRAHGHFDGKPGAHDALAARKILQLFSRLDIGPAAVVFLRDSDNDPDRRVGLEQARIDCTAPGIDPQHIAIGLAHPEGEAWSIAGFSPVSSEEREALATQRKRLGYDPPKTPERLHGNAKHDAKPVLKALTGGDSERIERCLRETDLDTLRQNGQSCGLAAFLDEIETRIVPAIA
ncbi:MAG: hypothetical protein KC457_30455 [Myxococcales bacterium]|nr:hypothetical protein [Myxococcales bacterium]